MGKITIRFILGLLFACIIASCRPSKLTREGFQYTRYCYDGKDGGLDTLIHLNGYYSFTVTFDENAKAEGRPAQSAYKINCLFLKDGMFIYNVGLPYSKKDSEKRFGFYNKGYWGKYIVEGDTIKTQFIEPPGGMSWESGQIWFKILGREKLERLYLKYREPIKQEEVIQFQRDSKPKKISPGDFVPYTDLPDPDKSWLKKRKWFWCNSNEYKIWKKAIEDKGRD